MALFILSLKDRHEKPSFWGILFLRWIGSTLPSARFSVGLFGAGAIYILASSFEEWEELVRKKVLKLTLRVNGCSKPSPVVRKDTTVGMAEVASSSTNAVGHLGGKEKMVFGTVGLCW